MEGWCHREDRRKVTQIGCNVQECHLLLDIHRLSKQQSIARIARSIMTNTVQHGPVRYSTIHMAACTNSAANNRLDVNQCMYSKLFKPMYMSN